MDETAHHQAPSDAQQDLVPRRRQTRDALRRRSLNHRVRLAAKRYTQEHPGEVPCRTHHLDAVDCCSVDQHITPSVSGVVESPSQQDVYHVHRQNPPSLRNHVEQDIRRDCRSHQLRRQEAARSVRRPRCREENDLDRAADGIRLARSRVSLPSDRIPTVQRTPSLEREDAFCDQKTYKGKVHVKPIPQVASEEDDAQVAQLYQMGLLYDESDETHSETLHLNDIHHEEPVYSVRPARRSRRAKQHDYHDSLSLDLSFSDIGSDQDLAHLLRTSDSYSSDQHVSPHLAANHTSPPLRVIYELATSRPSIDVETSQLPELMDDSLSEYDCLSGSGIDDADDMPSQREVHDSAAAPASDPWVLLGDP